MLVFLEINGILVECTDDELVSLGQGLAESSLNEADLIEWIISHS
jgi:death-on-curing protein